MSDQSENKPGNANSSESNNRDKKGGANNRNRNRNRGNRNRKKEGQVSDGEGKEKPAAAREENKTAEKGDGAAQPKNNRNRNRGGRNRNNDNRSGDQRNAEDRSADNRNNDNRRNTPRKNDNRRQNNGKEVKASPQSEEYRAKLEAQEAMLSTDFTNSASDFVVEDEEVLVSEIEITHKPVLAITLGDLNGIGPEVLIKTLADQRITELCTPVIFGGSKTLNYHRNLTNEREFQYHQCFSYDAIAQDKINLFVAWEDNVEINIGIPTDVSGQYALKSLDAAVAAAKAGAVEAIVTAPINKWNIAQEVKDFTGHTGYLAAALESEVLMVLCSDKLRVATVTGHVPIKDVATSLTSDLIVEKLSLLAQSLHKDFGLVRPKIAVLGLNPHAGEMGTIGEEEETIIAPAIDRAAKKLNATVRGPFPADGFFGQGFETKFDAVLGMYHDQVLVPFKSLAMGSGTNFSAGLPVVRTSPDHGTAMHLAGKNCADESSFRHALFMAIDIVKQRLAYKEMMKNPLQKQSDQR